MSTKLQEFHDARGHFGPAIVLQAIRGKFYWPSRTRDVGWHRTGIQYQTVQQTYLNMPQMRNTSLDEFNRPQPLPFQDHGENTLLSTYDLPGWKHLPSGEADFIESRERTASYSDLIIINQWISRLEVDYKLQFENWVI